MDVNETVRLASRYHQQGNFQQAEIIYRKMLKFNPGNLQILNSLGNVLRDQHRYDEAIDCYQKAIQFEPTFAGSYYHLGSVFEVKGQYIKAINEYQKAIQYDPIFVGSYNNLGNVYRKLDRSDEAIPYFQKAIEVNPRFWGSYYNLGEVLQNKRQINEAIPLFQKALELNPKHIASLNNLGNCFRDKGLIDDAITCYQRAIQLQPNHEISFYNLACAFQEKGDLDEAVIDCCNKALEINPDFDKAYSLLTYKMQETCKWKEFGAMTAKLDDMTRKALDTGIKPVETPSMSIRRQNDPSVNFAIAKLWSRDIEKAMSARRIHFPFSVGRKAKSMLVVGYLSDRFGDTATAHLMLSLFGLHNRDEFSINCYSYGKDDGSYYRTRIERDSDKFVDISNLNDDDAARCINEDHVDILVDLKGYTKGSRLEICGFRPVPIQVSYLGFAGSTGANFIDYIITDKMVSPVDHSLYYSEKFVYMPHCYLVNDHTQPISNKDFKKVDFGLPENSFVFCSFNQPYKIDPTIFDVWMKILKQVPESVLWLLFGNKIAEENLRREAEARGVDSKRLIFSKSLPKNEHLSRLKLADLALDTRIVNGHTTTSDALWAGIPVITLQGNHLASRVSSSVLSAIGLPDLITRSLESYEALAAQLANNPGGIQEIRRRVAENRLVKPLFDTPRFVRNLERAYKEMWKIFISGESPRQIEVSESGP